MQSSAILLNLANFSCKCRKITQPKSLSISSQSGYLCFKVLFVQILYCKGLKKFAKILFPNKKFASSLYKKLGANYFDHLESPGVRGKIEKKKRAP